MIVRPPAGRLLAIAVALVFVVGGCSGGEHQRAGAPTLGEVRALLARHGQALLDHSSKDFLADVDTAPASKAFRAEQADELDNISDVPLTSWTYAVDAPVTDESAEQAADKRYGAQALIVQVTLSYRLTGIDQVPAPKTLWWTFVRRGGHVYLAGDDDLAQAGGVSWRGPWDFGPVVVARGSSSLVLGHIANATALTRLADAVDRAIPAVSAVWGTRWAQRVAVLAPADAVEFTALVGSSNTSPDVSAVAITDGIDPLTHQPYGQRLVMDPAALGKLSTLGEAIVIRHEITHLAAAASTSDTTPRWLVEGFADFVAQEGDGQSVRLAAAELRAEVARGTVPATLPADSAFAVGAERLPQTYEQSWLACRLIAARIGTAGLVRFYRQVGTAVLPASFAVAQALRDQLRVTTATFTAQWRAYLRAELA
ncbi:MAG: hypothetical protein ACRDWT_00975 [Jatrophihabitantaceae bacterium]